MDFFNSRYFVINKTLLNAYGLWADETRTRRLFKRGLTGFLMIVMTLPQLNGLMKNFGHNVHKTLIHVTSLLYMIEIVVVKLGATYLAENKIQLLLNKIDQNWRIIKDEHEQRILMRFSETGRRLSIFYITYMTSALLLFLTVPMTPIIFDKIHSKNESRQLLYILYGEYPFDHEKNYTKIYIVEAIVSAVSVFIFCTIDTTYVVCTEHCLGLFAIVKLRLEKCVSGKATNDRMIKVEKNNQQDVAYDVIVRTIKLHKQIIEFAEQLESSYSTSFLFLIAVNGIYTTLLCVLILQSKEDFIERSRFGTIMIGLIIHIFYVSWPGQKLIDYSSGLICDAYSNEWYESSIRAQNLLRFMMLRCSHPCQLTAGGIYVMNFKNFAVIVKTSLSYIAVFSSMAK